MTFQLTAHWEENTLELTGTFTFIHLFEPHNILPARCIANTSIYQLRKQAQRVKRLAWIITGEF